MTGSPLAFSTLGETGMTVEQIVDLARASSARGVELRVADGEALTAASAPEDAAAVGSAVRNAGLTLLALTSYVRLCAPLDGAADAADDPVLADLIAHLELASAAGALGVRVFMQDDAEASGTPAGAGLTDGERRAATRLSGARDAVDRTGVRVLIETHDSHPSAASLVAFLAAQPLDAGQLGVIWDTAHSWAAGEPLEQSMQLLADRLAHLQIKDVASAPDPRPTPIGSGSFPIDELASVLEHSAWHGWVSLEWERAWHPDLPPLAEALPTARTWAHRILDNTGDA